MYGINNYKTQQHPDPVNTSLDDEYDYSAASNTTPTPTTSSAQGLAQNLSYQSNQQHNGTNNNMSRDSDRIVDPEEYSNVADEALQDLAELEELQNEAERMKAVGNKHMAAQEYIQAYNAYSAALQLSPVGPSSHVFLSNRAAALLSLKRYPAAATDARRAVALAPTFGKAHARLGQALYFLKDYQGAVNAYQDALQYEPDNEVTRTYLEKAEHKLEKQRHRTGGTDVSVMTEMTGLTTAIGQMSVATDPEGRGIMQNRQYAGATQTARATMLHATAKQPITSPVNDHGKTNQPVDSSFQTAGEDPEFEEALRIQQRANTFLVQKKYRQAIEEYTAALFLVPDDVNLSPDLHLGRAHALNGSRRHESAKNDAILALRLQESAAAYSTLAKSLFYMKDYQGAIDAFVHCQEKLPEGETLGQFDQAYFEKAERALQEEAASLGEAGRIHGGNVSTSSSSKASVPKLRPPRFVPREEAVHSPSSMPSMPKTWPQQSPRTSSAPLKCGPEREIMCLSEGLGVKLNRGSDGVVRVLTVTDPASSPELVRQGEIHVGDVIREAAGVDIRRPITNIMWGDTVALIKMAPRPITLVVAEELSPVPSQVVEEQRKALSKHGPSRASDDSAVVKHSDDASASGGEDNRDATPQVTAEGATVEESADCTDIAASASQILKKEEGEDDDEDIVEMDDLPASSPRVSVKPNLDTVAEKSDEDLTPASSVAAPSVTDENEDDDIESVEDEGDSQQSTPTRKKNASTTSPSPSKSPVLEITKSLRDEEAKIVGGEILFLRDCPKEYGGWDTLRWMAHNGARKVNFCQPVFRLLAAPSKRKGLPLFWKQGVGKQYEERTLVVYDEPSIILVVRRPTSIVEIQQLLGLGDDDDPGAGSNSNWELNPDTALTSYWVLESVADPASSKLRLSSLTTATSVAAEHADDRERSCFQILTPTETISLSAVHVRTGTKKREQSFKDSGAFLETLSVEASISQAICAAHRNSSDLGAADRDIAWKHQLIIGSLHSLVLSGNPKALEEGILQARQAIVLRGDMNATSNPNHLPSRIIDAVDDNGFTALYYACKNKFSSAVNCLVNAGATVHIQTEEHEMSMLHVSSRNLDELSLATMLAAPSRPDPNVLDKKGRTPMYVALVEGSALSKTKDPDSLGGCIAALKAWGGKMLLAESPTSLRNPISAMAYMNLPDYISVALDHVPHRFPLSKIGDTVPGTDSSMSLGAVYQYPVHSALVALRKHMRKGTESNSSSSPESSLVRTLRVLFEHGFEPNERLDRTAFTEKTAFDEFVGFAPIQILALVALELDAIKGELDAVVVNNSSRVIADTAEILVRSGARLSLDPPPTERPRNITETTVAEASSVRKVEILTQKLDADKHLLALLGGELRLNSAFREWSEIKKVATMKTADLLQDDKASIEDSSSAGGSDCVSCTVCWSNFGSLLNRKHKCRVTRKYVCDACSTKRLIQGTMEYRLSDGQFNLARVDAVREETVRVAAEKEKERNKALAAENARALARLDRLEATEQSNRETLFGGMLEAATNYVMGEDQNGADATAQQVSGLTASLDQTRDALNQRGEKLGALNEKSSKLVEASADFANMAKELRKQSEGGLFW